MAIFENILLALESLKMNRMRSILTMLGIIIGIGSVIAISTVGSSLTGYVSDSMTSLGASSINVSLTKKSSDDDSSRDFRVKMFASETPDSADLITDEMIEEYKAAFPDDVKYVEKICSAGTATYGSDETSVTVTGVEGDYVNA